MAAELVRVDRRPDESDEKLIKRYLKKVRKEGILKEVFERRSHKTKAQKRREKHLKAVRRKQKDARKAEQNQ
jgi:ribosomal protein S21